MKTLKGKTALVTGSAKGLGREVALYLATQGAHVGVHFHESKKEAEKTLSLVSSQSSGILVQADITNEQEVDSMIQKIKDTHGSIDILINLVGNFIYEPITTTSYVTFRDVIDTNLFSTFLCCNAVLPDMKEKKWGKIINFGCIAADTLTIRQKTTPYYIAKTGVIMLTRVLAYEYAPYGISINSISPGILETSIAKPPTPTGTYIACSDIVHGIDMLLHPSSDVINGANIEIAHGWRPGFT